MSGIPEGVIHSEIHVYKIQDSCLDLFQKYSKKKKKDTQYSLAQRKAEPVVVDLGKKKRM